MSDKANVLDANTRIRAVLGSRVREVIMERATTVRFFAPEVAYADARKYLPAFLERRDVPGDVALEVLDGLLAIVHPVDKELHSGLQQQALQRIAKRDADDWPVLASALALDCPIWTEDANFFGTGVATWTTDRVALYFS